MLKIGIIGAENSHCAAIARLCNVQKKVGARVVCVWGETRRFAEEAAAAARIPTIVADWRDMVGRIDGVMIDHRHPRPHAAVARFFLSKKVPCFVDKPFTYTLRQGKALCNLARRMRTPLTSFSTIPRQRNFQKFKKACEKLGPIVNLTTTGPVDLHSKYGGIFFYGIHQVDGIVELLGTRVRAVNVIPHGQGGVAVLWYQNGPTGVWKMMNFLTSPAPSSSSRCSVRGKSPSVGNGCSPRSRS